MTRRVAAAVAVTLSVTAQPVAAQSGVTTIARIDLSGPFHARSPWRLVATQDSAAREPSGAEEDVPGVVHLCLQRTPLAPCDPTVTSLPKLPPAVLPTWWEPHFLTSASLVYPRGKAGTPLLLLRTESVVSGDGDQLVFTRLLAYRSTPDRFEQIYAKAAGHNNNQEVRFVASGPLEGAVISAEPTGDAPYGFWITVERFTADYTYRQALRFRSATRYGDGNPLAVIDSEMPNIQRRLGLWRPGKPLPLPAYRCEKPRLLRMELWCAAKPGA